MAIVPGGPGGPTSGPGRSRIVVAEVRHGGNVHVRCVTVYVAGTASGLGADTHTHAQLFLAARPVGCSVLSRERCRLGGATLDGHPLRSPLRRAPRLRGTPMGAARRIFCPPASDGLGGRRLDVVDLLDLHLLPVQLVHVGNHLRHGTRGDASTTPRSQARRGRRARFVGALACIGDPGNMDHACRAKPVFA